MNKINIVEEAEKIVNEYGARLERKRRSRETEWLLATMGGIVGAIILLIGLLNF